MKVIKSIIDTVIITAVVVVTLSGIVEQPSHDTPHRAADLSGIETHQA